MSTTTNTRQAVPVGTWQLDPIHSTIGFEVDYLAGSFRGQFREVAGKLQTRGETPVLTGSGLHPPEHGDELNTAIAHLRNVLGEATYESLARKGESMTTAAMATYASDQIDLARAELKAVST